MSLHFFVHCHLPFHVNIQTASSFSSGFASASGCSIAWAGLAREVNDRQQVQASDGSCFSHVSLYVSEQCRNILVSHQTLLLRMIKVGASSLGMSFCSTSSSCNASVQTILNHTGHFLKPGSKHAVDSDPKRLSKVCQLLSQVFSLSFKLLTANHLKILKLQSKSLGWENPVAYRLSCSSRLP